VHNTRARHGGHTVAANKVKVYDLNRKPLPEGWVVGERGGGS
jgi:LDH2 family malate/lactate/ureidoglycolate dehydrogenase